ncbi:MAG: ZIP family metal transporter [Gemmatimonadaceae bacterium]|nr:ZIP family metal transporter [Gemmatimonadaceae bacterium]
MDTFHGALTVFLAALWTAVATGFGAIPFAFVRNMSSRTMGLANALAAGLMLGASFGLVAEGAQHGVWQTVTGAATGLAFILMTQRYLAGHEVSFGDIQGAGARKMILIVVVMTVHSFAEGVAVGVSFGGGASLATAITVAIAVHNIPEGLAISAVLRPRGASLWSCAWWSVFSSLPQPIMAVPSWLFVEHFQRALPFGLGFAAGAMIYVVLVELLPEAYEAEAEGANEASEPAWAPMSSIAATVTLSLVGMLLFQRALA